ncbi:MAG TPA: L,D-transpeptidase family protein [Gemmatimonadaceae bacterium]|nr:L,D-transpeptidase family protein [Gemmatimonadaceae bacterium]
MTAIMFHNLCLARRHAVAILASMTLALAGLPAGAQSSSVGSFAEAAARAAAAAGAGFARRSSLQQMYSGTAVRPFWTANGRPTRQALAVIGILGDVATRGLDARNYGSAELATMAGTLDGRSDSTRLARFDVALSRSVIQLLGDLHEGRTDPSRLGFHLPPSHSNLDLAAMAVDMSAAPDPNVVITSAEPVYTGYRALEATLARYRTLAADTSLKAPPPAKGTLHVGDSYAGAEILRRLLVALGDLSPSAAAADATQGAQYSTTLSTAVAAFQRRHGLVADGVAGPSTMRALRVPLAHRVQQIELTLERWRWLPDSVPSRYAVVNIPGFRLYLFENDRYASKPEIRMNVIVGRAGRSRATPIFTGTMSQVVIRPYWDVPASIARNEIIPATRRRWGYFADQNLEIVSGGDVGARVYPLSSANLSRVASGSLRIRQRPGPNNSLGLIKFLFPNEFNVYLHDTPAQSLFSQSQRDFSHGCIRVQDPLSLAEFVLRDQDGWIRSSIDSAMHGTKTIRISMSRPVAVYILYQTAVVAPEGIVYFYDDLYGHDARLAQTLARSRPPAWTY